MLRISIGSPSTALTNWADTGIIEPLNSYIDKDEEYQKVNDPYNHKIRRP